MVDLDSLFLALRGIGCSCNLDSPENIDASPDDDEYDDLVYGSVHVFEPVYATIANDGGFELSVTASSPDVWSALDIIRKHVSPAPAGEELRERIAKAIYERWMMIDPGPGNLAPPWERKTWYETRSFEVADAVLAVLNGEGIGGDALYGPRSV